MFDCLFRCGLGVVEGRFVFVDVKNLKMNIMEIVFVGIYFVDVISVMCFMFLGDLRMKEARESVWIVVEIVMKKFIEKG